MILPGVKPEEVYVSVGGDCSTIKGKTKGEEKVEREDYLYRNHRYGIFCRTIALPNGLVTDKAKASVFGATWGNFLKNNVALGVSKY